MRYSDVETHIREGLVSLAYGTAGKPVMPAFDPGPFTIERVQKKFPGPVVFAVYGNGIGLAKEGLFDLTFITVRVVGAQNDFAYAERLAYDVDSLLVGDGNLTMGTGKALYVTRTGAPPQLVDLDAADRYHFQTTYITEAMR